MSGLRYFRVFATYPDGSTASDMVAGGESAASVREDVAERFAALDWRPVSFTLRRISQQAAEDHASFDGFISWI